jgi:hypothetical protein
MDGLEIPGLVQSDQAQNIASEIPVEDWCGKGVGIACGVREYWATYREICREIWGVALRISNICGVVIILDGVGLSGGTLNSECEKVLERIGKILIEVASQSIWESYRALEEPIECVRLINLEIEHQWLLGGLTLGCIQCLSQQCLGVYISDTRYEI